MEDVFLNDFKGSLVSLDIPSYEVTVSAHENWDDGQSNNKRATAKPHRQDLDQTKEWERGMPPKQ